MATPGSSLIVEVDPNTVTAASLNALIASLAGPLGERDGGATIVLPSSRGLEDGRYKFDEPIKIRQHGDKLRRRK